LGDTQPLRSHTGKDEIGFQTAAFVVALGEFQTGIRRLIWGLSALPEMPRPKKFNNGTGKQAEIAFNFSVKLLPFGNRRL